MQLISKSFFSLLRFCFIINIIGGKLRNPILGNILKDFKKGFNWFGNRFFFFKVVILVLGSRDYKKSAADICHSCWKPGSNDASFSWWHMVTSSLTFLRSDGKAPLGTSSFHAMSMICFTPSVQRGIFGTQNGLIFGGLASYWWFHAIHKTHWWYVCPLGSWSQLQ